MSATLFQPIRRWNNTIQFYLVIHSKKNTSFTFWLVDYKSDSLGFHRIEVDRARLSAFGGLPLDSRNRFPNATFVLPVEISTTRNSASCPRRVFLPTTLFIVFESVEEAIPVFKTIASCTLGRFADTLRGIPTFIFSIPRRSKQNTGQGSKRRRARQTTHLIERKRLCQGWRGHNFPILKKCQFIHALIAHAPSAAWYDERTKGPLSTCSKPLARAMFLYSANCCGVM